VARGGVTQTADDRVGDGGWVDQIFPCFDLSLQIPHLVLAVLAHEALD
jgi:hypothetical protein